MGAALQHNQDCVVARLISAGQAGVRPIVSPAQGSPLCNDSFYNAVCYVLLVYILPSKTTHKLFYMYTDVSMYRYNVFSLASHYLSPRWEHTNLFYT